MRPWPRKMGTAFGRRFWQCSDGRQFADRRRAEEHEGDLQLERQHVTLTAREARLALAKWQYKLRDGMAEVGGAAAKLASTMSGASIGFDPAAATGPLAWLDREVAAVCAAGRGEA